MKTLRINREHPASAVRPAEPLEPKPESPAEHYTHRIILNVFGKRFELTHRVNCAR
jgi:hypothetical protein